MGWLDLSTKGGLQTKWIQMERRWYILYGIVIYQDAWIYEEVDDWCLILQWDVVIPYLTSINCLSLKINAHLNMHDSVLFSGFWDDLLHVAWPASVVALWYKLVPFKGASAFIFPPTKLLTPGQESCEKIFWFSVQYYVCKFGHEAHLRLLWFCLYGFGSRTFTRNEKTDQGAGAFVAMCREDVFISRFFWGKPVPSD